MDMDMDTVYVVILQKVQKGIFNLQNALKCINFNEVVVYKFSRHRTLSRPHSIRHSENRGFAI